MQRLSLLGLFLLALLLNACSDDSASPNNGGQHGNFAIVSVDQDSVYWGDTVNIIIRNASSNSITVYLHSVPIVIDTIWSSDDKDRNVRFIVPMDASSGLIRVYDSNSVQASGDHSLVVFPQDPGMLAPRLFGFKYDLVYTNDLITILGEDLPLRRSDLRVVIGGTELPLESHDVNRIIARVTPEVRTGGLSVRMLDTACELGTVRKLEHKGEFLQIGDLTSLAFDISHVNGRFNSQIIKGSDTTNTFREFSGLNATYSFNSIHRKPSTDSIIYVAENVQADMTQTVEFYLKPESESRVSGVIKIRQVEATSKYWIEIKLKNMRWILDNGRYYLRAYGVDVSRYLEDVNGEFALDYSGRYTVETLNFGGSNSNSELIFECVVNE